MRASPDSRRLLGRRSIPRSAAGVGLVELMVVVLIISMLMAMAVPSYQRVKKRAKAGALVNDFRVFSGVLQSYAHENGAWPAESPSGVVPTGITSDQLHVVTWTTPTPTGGTFDWDYLQVHPGGTSPGGTWRAAITISDNPGSALLVDLELFRMMDELIDDGNLNTGNFRLGNNNCPVYILEQ